MKFRDRLWLWGQDANSHQESPANEFWKLPDGNCCSPGEGTEYLGINKVCRVVMNGLPRPPFDAETEKLQHCGEVVWSAIGDLGSVCNDKSTDLQEVLRQAENFSNVTGAVLDDFFRAPTADNPSCARYSVKDIESMRNQLHQAKRPLDLWLVWYKQQLEFPISDYIKLFDVITFWNMAAIPDHAELRKNLDRFIELTPDTRRFAGCYLWDYANGRELTVDEVKYECEIYYELIKAGKLEGIVFCSNCFFDFKFAAVEWTRNWIREIGEEEF